MAGTNSSDTPKIVARHKKVAFFGVIDNNTETFQRMTKFTQLTPSKNPQEYQRKYVDEPIQQTDLVGFSPSIAYAFDRHRNCAVQDDIVKITDEELLADDAVRNIVIVDIETSKAVMRAYSVIPNSEGDNTDIYTYSGNFKCKGERILGTASSTDNWETCIFHENTED